MHLDPNHQYDGLTLLLGSSEKLKTVKIVRLLRLLKLVKVLSGSSIYERYKAELSISLHMVSLINNCLKMLIVSHWFACAWILVAMFECDHDCMLDEGAVNMRNDHFYYDENNRFKNRRWVPGTVRARGNRRAGRPRDPR